VLYRFFTDRADLQNAVSELALTALVDRVTDELRRDRDPADQVRVVIGEFLRGVDEDPQLWRFVLRDDPAQVGIRTGVVEDARAQIARVLTTVLTDRLRDAGLGEDGAEVWAHGLFGMVHATADWWLRHRTMSRDAVGEELSTLVWGGLSGALGPERLGAHAPESGVEINATEDFG
jgi:AcrR family transcriptional regulator